MFTSHDNDTKENFIESFDSIHRDGKPMRGSISVNS